MENFKLLILTYHFLDTLSHFKSYDVFKLQPPLSLRGGKHTKLNTDPPTHRHTHTSTHPQTLTTTNPQIRTHTSI